MIDVFILAGLFVCLVLFVRGLFLAVFKRGRRKAGLLWVIASPVLAVVAVLGGLHVQARIEGWPSMLQKDRAEKAGITDPVAWQKIAEAEAEKQRIAAELKAKTDAKAKADAKAAEAAQAAADAAQAKAEEADFRRKGFHCLSAWSGNSDSFVDAVKAQLRDPDSFEAIETLIGPVDGGKHPATMTYRARNGFGGMNVAQAAATIDTETCAATVLLIE